jgi:hypothetical protein
MHFLGLGKVGQIKGIFPQIVLLSKEIWAYRNGLSREFNDPVTRLPGGTSRGVPGTAGPLRSVDARFEFHLTYTPQAIYNVFICFLGYWVNRNRDNSVFNAVPIAYRTGG